MNPAKKELLLIGGFDPSAGAGLATDLRVAKALKIPTRLIVTTLAFQSDRTFLRSVNLSPSQLQKQLDDIDPSKIAAIKLGALGSIAPWKNIIKQLAKWRVPIVLDTVYRTSSGGLLLNASQKNIRKFYRDALAPYCAVLTPNYPEACFLLEESPTKQVSAFDLIIRLSDQISAPLLLKGGHLATNPIIDILLIQGRLFIYSHKSIKRNVRGTGCALATALAGYLIKRENLAIATQSALTKIACWIASARQTQPGVYHLLSEQK